MEKSLTYEVIKQLEYLDKRGDKRNSQIVFTGSFLEKIMRKKL